MTTRTRPSSRARLKKTQLSFYVEPEDYQALKELSRRTGVPQQVYMRRGLAAILRTSKDSTARERARRLNSLSTFQAELDAFNQQSSQALSRVRSRQR